MTFPEPGTRFFQLSWVGTIAFVVTAGAAATSPSTFELAAVAVSLTLFFAGIVTMLWAFFIAVNRSRVDAIGVGGLYFGAGSTPKVVRWNLLGATTVQLVAGIVTIDPPVHPARIRHPRVDLRHRHDGSGRRATASSNHRRTGRKRRRHRTRHPRLLDEGDDADEA